MTVAEAYELLGLSPTANEQELKRAYRRALRTAHPDAGGSDREFIAVRSAYHAVLRARSAGRARDSGSESGPSTREQATARKRRSPATKARVQVVGSRLRPEQYAPFSHGETYHPGFFGAFSAGKKRQEQAERFAATVLTRRIPRALPAARLINGLKIPAQPRIPHLLLSGYRAVLLFPLQVPDARYQFRDDQLRSDTGRIPTPHVAQIRRAFESRFPQLNTIAKIVPITAAMDSQRPRVTSDSATAGSRQELVSAANLSTAAADAVLFLAAGPQPHVLDIDLLASLIDVE